MLRTSLVLLALAGFTASAAEPQLTAALVLPPVPQGAVPEGLPLVMQERANAQLLATKHFSVAHARIISAMAARHRMKSEQFFDPNVARSAAERAGASIFVYSQLSQDKDGYTLELATSKVGAPAVSTSTVKLGSKETEVVLKAEQALAQAVLTFAGLKDKLQTFPDAPSDAAMRDYAECASLVNRQPIGIENPTILDEEELIRAISHCEAAVKAAPKFAEAHAALALASTIANQDDAAIVALTAARALKRPWHLPNLTLARFWLVTRYQSGDAGATLLKDAIKAEPGFLLARGYLAELDNTLGNHKDAATIWREYAALTPDAPYIISRLAYTLARLGQPAEAAAFAEKAIAFDRESIDLNLELASRYIDAAQPEKAITMLEPLAKPADARGELIVRLGYAYLVKGDLDVAEKTLQRGVAAAKQPSEWRTRGRGDLNLATIAFKRGKKDEAKRLVLEAARQGLTITSTPENKDVVALVPAAELAKAQPPLRLKSASPLPVAGGDVAPDQARPAPPKGFDVAVK